MCVSNRIWRARLIGGWWWSIWRPSCRSASRLRTPMRGRREPTGWWKKQSSSNSSSGNFLLWVSTPNALHWEGMMFRTCCRSSVFCKACLYVLRERTQTGCVAPSLPSLRSSNWPILRCSTWRCPPWCPNIPTSGQTSLHGKHCLKKVFIALREMTNLFCEIRRK